MATLTARHVKVTLLLAARRHGAAEIIDPRPWAVGSIADTFEKYPTTGDVLPAMGYGAEQTAELQQTIADTPAELVSSGRPSTCGA